MSHDVNEAMLIRLHSVKLPYQVIIAVILTTLIILYAKLFSQMSLTAGSPLNHFSQLTEWDAIHVTWAHAVNSQAELDEALSGPLMFLEADVRLQGEGTENQTDVPIMAHPPDIESDITLEEWMRKVTNKSLSAFSRGIKLDFKSTAVLSYALDVIIAQKDAIHQPVWLNADIILGPGGNPPVDKDVFLQTVTDKFPHCTLSVGWTTGWTNSGSDPVYDEAMVAEMTAYLQSVQQPVTFPVRASMLARSWTTLMPLLQPGGRTFTVWSSKTDEVDVQGLVDLRNAAGADRVYFDLPDPLMDELLGALNMTRT